MQVSLFLVNALTCGLEVCLAAGTIYTPTLLLQAGMEERYMTMVLGVGPILGLIFVPMIGSASDSWRGRYGRRRPFIWFLCGGFLLGLLVMPHARHLAALLSSQRPQWLELVLLAGSVCLMEFCGQTCFTPLEALLSDKFPGEEESTRAFSVYSLMISLGACLGFLLPAMDWSHVSTATYMGGKEAFIFSLLTLIFLGCLLSTALISEEGVREVRGGEISRKTVAVSPLLKTSGWKSRHCVYPFLPRLRYLCPMMGRCVPISMSVLSRVYSVCVCMPAVILRLFVAELCSWMAVMSFMMFYADFMGEGLYQGVPNAMPGTQERQQYDEGVRMASLGLLLQSVTSVVCSLLMHHWVVLIGARAVYVSSVALLVLATAVMSLSDSVLIVTVMAATTGYTYCVLQVLPYTLLCLYHSDRQIFFSCSRPGYPVEIDDPAHSRPLLPPDLVSVHSNDQLTPSSPHLSLPPEKEGGEGNQRGMCLDMAILDSAYLLSQVLPALCLGSIVQQFSSVRAYMASACSFSLLALLCSTRIIYNHNDLQS